MDFHSVQPFLDYYEHLRERTNKLVATIPADKMDWTYKEGKYTIADMLRHIAALERYMFAENVQGRPSRYNGCGKDLADGCDNVVAFFNEMHRQSMEIFSSLTDADLQEKCKTPAGTPITTWKWLRAMTEHEIHHRGELYIYLNMIDVTTPPMFGLSAEEVEARSIKQGNQP